MRAAFLLLALAALAAPAKAEGLAAGLSEDLVRVSGDFVGTDLVVFGAVESPDPFATAEGRDIVVVVRGPDVPATVRRKEHIAGLWVNADAVTFQGLPGFYYVASTRPLSEIASLAVLERYELGLLNLKSSVVRGEREGAEAFRAAAVRLKVADGLYRQSDSGVEQLGASLFRATVPLPANVPPGSYKTEVYLFRNGAAIDAWSQPLPVDKTGFERRLFRWATEDPFVYGVVAVLLAVAMGWLSSVVLRER